VTSTARSIFLGSGAFAVPIVSALAGHRSIDLAAVVTAAPAPKGRGQRLARSRVAEWAEAAEVVQHTPPRLRDPAAVADIARLRPDLLVLADYGQLVPAELLELPRFGALNVHPSLLPRHRGASPIPAAILAADDATGVSLMLMDAGLDSGPLIAQRDLPLHGTETAPELERRLAELGAAILADSLAPWLAGELRAVPQPAEGVTMTRALQREDGRLDPWRPAAQLERQVRAYQPWPGSYLDTASTRLVVWRARSLVADDRARERPATLVELPATGLGLVTADGILELVEVQPAGGRRMSGAELLRGRPGLAGSMAIDGRQPASGADATMG
jgi:methionyl-tRNA formyltransferase